MVLNTGGGCKQFRQGAQASPVFRSFQSAGTVNPTLSFKSSQGPGEWILDVLVPGDLGRGRGRRLFWRSREGYQLGRGNKVYIHEPGWCGGGVHGTSDASR